MIPLMLNAFSHEKETREALAKFILKADRLSMGVECSKFETSFAAFQGSKEAVLFNSGGSANLAILQALKNLGRLRDGDRVGFSALTWSTNTMPIIQMGMVPVPIDCSPETLNVMSSNVKESIAKQDLKAIFLTNVLGFAGDLDTISLICKELDIIAIEDNCEALGSELAGQKTGTFGLCASFSFFVAHHMSTIEGGMVCTDDAELATMLRITRANGWDRNLNAAQQKQIRKQHNITSEFDAKYTFYYLGFNLRPTEITGFLGQIQLSYLSENISKRNQLWLHFNSLISANVDLVQLDSSHMSYVSAFALPVIAKTPDLRRYYLEQFSGAGIEVRPMIAGNMQRQPFYKKYIGDPFHEELLPGADFIHHCGFYCGIYPEMSEEAVNIISSCLMK